MTTYELYYISVYNLIKIELFVLKLFKVFFVTFSTIS